MIATSATSQNWEKREKKKNPAYWESFKGFIQNLFQTLTGEFHNFFQTF
jgi:hypothetical protein